MAEEVKSYLFGRVGGWLEIWRLNLISTQDVIEVEVGVELSNNLYLMNKKIAIQDISHPC